MPIVFTWPDGRMHRSISEWVRRHLGQDAAIHEVNVQPYFVALESAIGLFRRSEAERCLLIEHDLVLRESADQFWLPTADIVCIRYGNEGRWAGREDEFHTGMWRFDRKIFERMKQPFWVTDEAVCMCHGFAEAARKAGLSIRHAGWAGHLRGKEWANYVAALNAGEGIGG
jgi:hypothetical protein